MAKTNMVSLEYCFIFSREANIWNNLYEFEKDLADFFAANQLEAEVISPISSSGGRGYMLLRKIDTNAPTLVNTKGINLRKSDPKKELLYGAKTSKQIVQRLTDSLGKGKKRK